MLDVRPSDEFAAGHVPGSISIALSGQFASWAGGILGIHSNPVLIGDSDEQIAEARLRLARVGIEDLLGYLAGGVAAWQQAGLPLSKTTQILRAGTEPETARGKLARRSTFSTCVAKANGKRVTFPKCNAGRSIRFRKDCPQSIGSARLRCTAKVDTAA